MNGPVTLKAFKNFGLLLIVWPIISNVLNLLRGVPLGLPRLWGEWWFWIALLVGFALRLVYDHKKART